VKLLFDQNLSRRLVVALQAEFPGSIHVSEAGLEASSDGDVWAYALNNGLVIVSKDSDFHQRSFVFGAPPKVIWIRRGNCSTVEIETILRRHRDDILEFVQNDEGTFLLLP
jgi:predicted nuclease of predicted toxin-antitoxin system